MDVDPIIRTPREKPAREIYERYIQSASWRVTRNHALRQAGYRCQRCDTNRDLQVHHLTYERLGREWDQDLEVVCKSCHDGVHLEQMRSDDHGRLYLKLANDAVRDTPRMSSIADLADVVKTKCATMRIRYDSHQVDKALGLITGQPRVSFQAAKPEVKERPQYPPLSKAEACRIWEELTEQGLPLEQLQAQQSEETKARVKAEREQFRAQAERVRLSKCERCQKDLTADQLERGERFCSVACAESAGVIRRKWDAAKARVLAAVERCEAWEREA